MKTDMSLVIQRKDRYRLFNKKRRLVTLGVCRRPGGKAWILRCCRGALGTALSSSLSLRVRIAKSGQRLRSFTAVLLCTFVGDLLG